VVCEGLSVPDVDIGRELPQDPVVRVVGVVGQLAL
jgi:hypothetical protein